MPDFQGAVGLRKICRIFLLHGGGRKVTGEGCNRASLCHSFTECPPLHYIYMYAVVSDRVAPGRGRKGPTPGHRFCRKRKKRCRVQRTQHRLNKSERNTIGPTSHVSALEKGAGNGYNKTVVQPKAVVLSGVDTHHRPVGWYQHPAGCRFIAFPASFYTMPRRKSSGFPHLRHGIPADPSAPASLLLLRWRASAPPLVHGDRLPTDGGIHGDASPAGVSFGPCRGILTSRPPARKMVR